LGLLNIDSPGLEAKPQGVDRLCCSHLTTAADAAQMLQAAGLAEETLGFTSCHVASKLLILARLVSISGTTCRMTLILLMFVVIKSLVLRTDHGCQPLTCENWQPGRRSDSFVAENSPESSNCQEEEASTDLPSGYLT
jgi:hypothetical protein